MSSSAARRRKRTVDIALSLLLLLLLPVSIWFVKEKTGFVRNCFGVLFGKRTWVGYHPLGAAKLPKLLQGVIDPVAARQLRPDPLTVQRVNITYAKDYRPWQDVKLVWKGFDLLGR